MIKRDKDGIIIRLGTMPMILICLLLVAMKAWGIIDWSWLWITFPLWGPAAIITVLVATVCALVLGGFTVLALVVTIYEAIRIKS